MTRPPTPASPPLGDPVPPPPAHAQNAPLSPADETQRTVEILCESFARDELDVQEFERRIDRAYRTPDPDALRALVADLPSAEAAPVDGAGASLSVPEPPAREVVVAVLGGAQRGGRRTAPRTSWVLAGLGGAEIDLREARFGPGVTRVRVAAVMGGVDVVVAPGTRVDCRGIALLGGFGTDGGDDELSQGIADPDGTRVDTPVLRIRGIACMGGVSVSVRRPGESAREARRRRRRERDERAPSADGGS